MDGRGLAPTQQARQRASKRQRIFWTGAVLCAAAIVGVFGTFAAFTTTTTNANNNISSGTVKIDQHAGSTSLYNATNKKPGEDTVGCVRVTYAGSLPSMVRLYTPSGAISNASAYNLKVERGTGLSSPGASMSCAGFTAASTFYDGALSAFGTSFASSNPGKTGGTAWATNDTVDYRFTITPNDDSAPNNHTSAQSTSAHAFTWEARNYAGYQASILQTTGLQSYWGLGQQSGSTAWDTSPYNTTSGVFSGGPTFGRPSLTNVSTDSATGFDGVDDYAGFGDVYDFAGTAAFSVEMWVNPNSSNESLYRRLISKESTDGNGRQGWDILLHSTASGTPRRIGFERWNNGTGNGALDTGPLTYGQRYHVVATYDGSIMRLYVDGAYHAAGSSSFATLDTTSPLRVGAHSVASGHFGGDIDDVSIYNRALTAAEVKAHYDAGA